MVDSSRHPSSTEETTPGPLDEPLLGSLAVKQAQLDQIAQALIEANQGDNDISKQAEGEPLGDIEGVQQETLQDKLKALLPPSSSTDLDWLALESRLADLTAEMADHSQRVLDTQVLDHFQAIELDGRPLADLTADDIQHWIQWYKEQGNFQAAEILAQAYAEFIRELNQKALEGHLFQQKQREVSAIQSQLEWRDVEQAYLNRVPELADFAADIREAVQARLQSDPLSRFTNKYVLVRDAIESMDIASKVSHSSSPKDLLPPDAQVQTRKVYPSSLSGKKNYRLSDLRATDYRALSSEDLQDLQNAMFEGRIQE